MDDSIGQKPSAAHQEANATREFRLKVCTLLRERMATVSARLQENRRGISSRNSRDVNRAMIYEQQRLTMEVQDLGKLLRILCRVGLAELEFLYAYQESQKDAAAERPADVAEFADTAQSLLARLREIGLSDDLLE